MLFDVGLKWLKGDLDSGWEKPVLKFGDTLYYDCFLYFLKMVLKHNS